MVGTIFAHDILNDLATALLAEVRIEVGHTDTLGVQESLKDQRVLHGVDFRNVHTIGHNRSRTGATAGTHRNSGFLGIADKVPDNEIVVHIAHTADDADLIFKSLHIAFRCLRITLPEAVHTELAEIFFIGIAFRHRERR